MNTANNGGPAFPAGLASGHIEPLHPGMTLRDYFAAKAMQGLLSHESFGVLGKATIADLAYEQADAMLRARGEA